MKQLTLEQAWGIEYDSGSCNEKEIDGALMLERDSIEPNQHRGRGRPRIPAKWTRIIVMDGELQS